MYPTIILSLFLLETPINKESSTNELYVDNFYRPCMILGSLYTEITTSTTTTNNHFYLDSYQWMGFLLVNQDSDTAMILKSTIMLEKYLKFLGSET